MTPKQDLDFQQFKSNVFRKTGIDLNQYKETQMKRRLTTFRDKKGYATFAKFYEALVTDSDLLHEFLNRMTINVSEFFRNPERWQILKALIIPRLNKNDRALKAWSAAASTGEEPYSLVMLLSQFYPLADIKILATDIDLDAIQKARQGTYVERSIVNVPKNLLHKYFTKDGAMYKLSADVMSRVHYEQHNLLADQFGTHFDLILCRNVLIYFTEEAKHMLYEKFAQALRPGGILFVGSTEQIFFPEKYGLKTITSFFYEKQ